MNFITTKMFYSPMWRRSRRNLILAGVLLIFPAKGWADQEAAGSADGFVDSIGVGTHITTISGVYADSDVATVESMLGALGVRHIRADMHGGDTAVFPGRIDYLYDTFGIRANMIGNCNATDISVASQASYASSDPAIESMEGLNEPDVEIGRHTPFSYTALNGTSYTDGTLPYATGAFAATQAFQNDLSDQLDGAKPLLSSAMGTPVFSRFLTEEPYPLDIESMHSYPWGRLPTGYGLDNSMIPGVNRLSPAGTLLPLIATETGYETGDEVTSGQPYVTEAAQGKYILRILAEYFNRGLTRTYSYDLIDDGTDETNQEDNFGLIGNDFTPKPAYTAEQNLISLLSEQSWNGTNWTGLADPNANPGVLDYNLIGALPYVHHTLLQKSNGNFYLLIWQEVLSCDIYHGLPHYAIANPSVPVTLTVNTPVQQIDTYLPSSSTTATHTYTYTLPQSQPVTVTLDVPDEVMVVKLTPATLGAPWAQSDVGTVGVAGSGVQAGGWAGEGALGKYYYNFDPNNPDNFSNLGLTRVDPSINFRWGNTPATCPIPAASTFGVRWTGQIIPQFSENYTFTTTGGTGLVLWVNGNKVIDDWSTEAPGGVRTSSPIALVAGQTYDIKMDTHDTVSEHPLTILQWSSPSQALSAISPANNWYVTGAGSNIWGAADAFHYVYQTMVGDGTITARVATLPPTYSGAAKAGVMIRQSLTDVGSPNACVLLTPSAQTNFQYRTTSGGTTYGVTASGAPPYWIRVQRSGNLFSGYVSANGTTWTQAGSTETISMGTTGTPVYVGFPVCSRSTAGVEAATFDSVSITYPTVSIQATTATASKSPVTAGVFTVTRTGSSSTSPALTVPYTIGGSAINGTDYATLSGSVTIPAGAASTTIAVTPLNGQVYPANATVKLTLESGTGYNLGSRVSDTVLIPSINVLADFENGSLASWTTQSQSALAIVSYPVDTGTHALKWTYTNVSGIPYSAEIHDNFAASAPQDWSRVTSVTIRFAADPSDPASDVGAPVYFDLLQNGSRVTGGWGIDMMDQDGLGNTYRTVTLNLSNYARTQITGIDFWVLSSSYSLGPHLWYIDNITTQ